METKHTTGQWCTNSTKKFMDGDGLAITSPSGVLIARVSHDLTDKTIDEYAANAILISSAPTMLQALVKIRETIFLNHEMNRLAQSSKSWQTELDEIDEVIKQASTYP